MTRLLADLRFALRNLRRSPLFAFVAVVSLALGIGANTAIFTLIDQLLLRLLPVKNPEQLVMIWPSGPHLGNNQGSRASSYPMYQDFQQKGQAFSYVFCRYLTALSVSFGGQTERVTGELVSGNYFQALGVAPAVGRLFTPEEDDRTYKGHPVAVLSYQYWINRFNGDRNIVGRKLIVNNYPFTVVGVSAPGFVGLDPSRSPQVRVPILMKPLMTPNSDGLADRRSQWINMFARMKPGFTVDSAKASLQPLFVQILREELQQPRLSTISQYFRDRFLKRQVQMETAATGYSQMRRNFSTALIVLMCMVGLVLLIACFNVANLLIARAAARQKEVAVRLAVGASRGQVLRQLLVESVLLSLAGGVAGLLLSVAMIRGLLSFLPADSSANMLRAEPDARILAFNFVLAALVGLLFGLAPAWQSLRLDLWTTLKDAGSAVTGVSSSVVLRKILVVAQVAFSFLLLAGAGLFTRTLANLKQTNAGFRQIDNLVTFQVDPSLNGYSNERMKSFHRELLDAIRAQPGVRSAAIARVPVLHGWEWDSSMSVQGKPRADGEDKQAFMNFVSPGYFETMGVPMLQGRDFTTRDFGDVSTVAIVNRKFATHYFGNESPIGRRIGFGGARQIRHRDCRGDGGFAL
jgi:predicted permease